MKDIKVMKKQLEKAVSRLEEVLSLEKTDVVRDSAIQRFEFCVDLSWKYMKVILESKHGIICKSPKTCVREAYTQKIIKYDEYWLELIGLRNLTVHTYNEETAEEIYKELPKALERFKEFLEFDFES